MTCRICNCNIGLSQIYKVKDHMLSSNQEFNYIECNHCSSIIIRDIPENILKYYPSNYYSFHSKLSIKEQLFYYLRDKLMYYNFPEILVSYFKNKSPNLSLQSFLLLKLNKNANILDVGCGEGKFLTSIYSLGFKNIMGIDPFIRKDIIKKFPIYKKNIFEINEYFDLITFHHVLEHVENINNTLKKCHSLLHKKGQIIIRVPIKDSYAFKKYKENWVQWDAPRHFQLLSKKGIEILAKNNFFSIKKLYFDSYDFQFTGSEKNRLGYNFSTPNNIFSASKMKEFKTKAKELNNKEEGDQVVVILEKI